MIIPLMIIEALIVRFNTSTSIHIDSFIVNVFHDIEGIKKKGRKSYFNVFAPLDLINASYRAIVRSSG